MNFRMPLQTAIVNKCCRTQITFVWPMTAVYSLMHQQFARRLEPFSTIAAKVRAFLSMRTNVNFMRIMSGESEKAKFALYHLTSDTHINNVQLPFRTLDTHTDARPYGTECALLDCHFRQKPYHNADTNTAFHPCDIVRAILRCQFDGNVDHNTCI